VDVHVTSEARATNVNVTFTYTGGTGSGVSGSPRRRRPGPRDRQRQPTSRVHAVTFGNDPATNLPTVNRRHHLHGDRTAVRDRRRDRHHPAGKSTANVNDPVHPMWAGPRGWVIASPVAGGCRPQRVGDSRVGPHLPGSPAHRGDGEPGGVGILAYASTRGRDFRRVRRVHRSGTGADGLTFTLRCQRDGADGVGAAVGRGVLGIKASPSRSTPIRTR